MKVSLTVNGANYERDVEPRVLLAYFLSASNSRMLDSRRSRSSRNRSSARAFSMSFACARVIVLTSSDVALMVARAVPGFFFRRGIVGLLKGCDGMAHRQARHYRATPASPAFRAQKTRLHSARYGLALRLVEDLAEDRV
jgi:hypothetical protein